MTSLPTLQRLIGELASEDRQKADDAGNEIMALGHAIIPDLLSAFGTAPSGSKRRLVYLLGAAHPDQENLDSVEDLLLRALADEDWKVRRNAAVAFGKRGSAKRLDQLLDCLAAEEDPRVRPSLVLALGNVAEPEFAEKLKGIS